MTATPSSADCSNRRALLALAGLAGGSELIYLAVVLSSQSLHETGTGGHSLLTLLALFGSAFGMYLLAVRIASRARQCRGLVGLIVAASVLFRLTLLFSDPIEEIDLYRYLWDGSVLAEGISPFRYSPQQVLAADAGSHLADDLQQLVALRDSAPEMTTILKRVHFGELPTIYPPVSQAVFALSAWMTPRTASLFVRMTLMKAWFVGFDLATLFVVIRLLRIAGRPMGLSLIYAWCPLVIKEIANSGHLDSLAFFLATLAIYVAVPALFRPADNRANRIWAAAGALGLLALACGAKLYPIVLFPLVTIGLWRKHGWISAGVACLAFAGALAPLAWPMLPRAGRTPDRIAVRFDPAQVAPQSDDAPPVPPQEVSLAPRDPGESLRAFLGEWEMNDFLFLIVIENLRPTAGLAPGEVAWFSIVPEGLRHEIIRDAESLAGVEAARAPFILTRALTSVVFIMLACWLAWRAARAQHAAEWLNTGFLTIAWFWLLLPTQNPWYWTWALPLVPFCRNRTWLMVSGLAFLYYLRFWLMHHFAAVPLLGTPYNGPLFFDYVVTWLEFGPWLVLLGWTYVWRRPDDA